MGPATVISRFFIGLRYHHVNSCKGSRPTTSIIVSLLVIPILFGCSGYLKPATPSPVLPSPSVEPTRLLAGVSGKIVIDDGCIRIISDPSGISYLLAFVPEYSVVIEEDQLRISESLKEDRIIKFDQIVVLWGGEVGTDKKRINAESLKNVPEHCEGNIWVAYLNETTNNDK